MRRLHRDHEPGMSAASDNLSGCAFGRCAKLLSLKSGTPVLYAVSRAVEEDGRTVVLSHDMFPANRVRLTTSRSLCPAR